MRASAKNDFKRNLFKLMNNAVYENTIKNVRKHSDIRITHPGHLPRQHEELLRYWDPVIRSLVVLHYKKI